MKQTSFLGGGRASLFPEGYYLGFIKVGMRYLLSLQAFSTASSFTNARVGDQSRTLIKIHAKTYLFMTSVT